MIKKSICRSINPYKPHFYYNGDSCVFFKETLQILIFGAWEESKRQRQAMELWIEFIYGCKWAELPWIVKHQLISRFITLNSS